MQSAGNAMIGSKHIPHNQWPQTPERHAERIRTIEHHYSFWLEYQTDAAFNEIKEEEHAWQAQ